MLHDDDVLNERGESLFWWWMASRPCPDLGNRRSQTWPRGPCLPKFLAHLVILWFEKRSPKQKPCCSPEVKHFSPPQILGWLTTDLGHRKWLSYLPAM